jgi:hypothetical protein
MSTTEQDAAEEGRWNEIEKGVREDTDKLVALVLDGDGDSPAAREIAQRM